MFTKKSAPRARLQPRGTVSRKQREGDVRARLLLGRGEEVLADCRASYTTAVGYAAGHTKNPTYREVCSGATGHTEVVLVVFDPKKVSYDTLLKTFWESHNPTQGMRQGNDVGTQYRSGIYYYGEAQRAAAERTRDEYQRALTKAGYGTITTRSFRRRSSTTPRTTTSSTCRRTPTATAVSAAPA